MECGERGWHVGIQHGEQTISWKAPELRVGGGKHAGEVVGGFGDLQDECVFGIEVGGGADELGALRGKVVAVPDMGGLPSSAPVTGKNRSLMPWILVGVLVLGLLVFGQNALEKERAERRADQFERENLALAERRAAAEAEAAAEAKAAAEQRKKRKGVHWWVALRVRSGILRLHRG